MTPGSSSPRHRVPEEPSNVSALVRPSVRHWVAPRRGAQTGGVLVKTRSVLIVACLLCCIVLPAAKPARATDPDKKFVLNLWSRKLDGIHKLLVRQQWEKAERKARKLSDQMLDMIVSGGGGRRYLGRVTLLRAIALEGLGEHRLADWYWRLSVQLFPDMNDVDPQTYIPGTDLGADAGGSSPAWLKAKSAHDGLKRSDVGRVIEPKKIDGREPRYPRAKIGTSVTVAVEVLIGEDGQLYEPRILDLTGEYTLAFSALDAMSSWRFKPATLDGKAMPALYQLFVRYISHG